MILEITRLIKFGSSVGITIPGKMRQQCRWNVGDRIALRYAEGKLILERVPLEALAKVRAGVVNGE